MDYTHEADQSLVAKAVELVGESTAAAAIGFLAGGLPDAIAAAATPYASAGLRTVLHDFASRHLSSREGVRVAAGFAFTLQRINERLESGDRVRGDGFWASDSGRPPAQEILEGVLLKCKSEHQERKVRFLGYLFANVAFMPDVSSVEANQLLQIAERLSYHQLAMISLVRQADTIVTRFSWGRVFSAKDNKARALLVQEIRGLTGLVHGAGNTVDPPSLEPIGDLLYRAMDLDRIPKQDLREIADTISAYALAE
jgi:hypothetical protein